MYLSSKEPPPCCTITPCLRFRLPADTPRGILYPPSPCIFSFTFYRNTISMFIVKSPSNHRIFTSRAHSYCPHRSPDEHLAIRHVARRLGHIVGKQVPMSPLARYGPARVTYHVDPKEIISSDGAWFALGHSICSSPTTPHCNILLRHLTASMQRDPCTSYHD
jgi:hypothetical protein